MAHHDPIGLIAPHAGLAQLNERSRDIFRQIVESYLATGEPVGSRNISRLITMPLSPASVRNVMSDHEQLGLIFAPHTSAGRLPTDRAGLFSTVTVMALEDESKITYTIVTNEESDLKKGLISLNSPLGKGFVGRQAGDEVKVTTPGGMKEFEILEVVTLHQKNAQAKR